MNEIQVLLIRKAPYEEKLAAFRKYYDPKIQGDILRSLDVSQPSPHLRQTLDYQLSKMKWRRDIEAAPKPQKRKHTIRKKVLHKYGIPGATLYPPEISKAIQNRSRAANLRERAGKKLVEQADQLSQIERAQLIQDQKTYHAVVVAETQMIEEWKTTGKVPTEPAPSSPTPTLSDAEKGELQKKKNLLMRRRSDKKKRIRQYMNEGNKNLEQEYRDQYQQVQEEIDNINRILGLRSYAKTKSI